MTTQVLAEKGLGGCFAAHRALSEAAAFLARKLDRSFDDADQLRLGSTCLTVAAQAALAARCEREAQRSWRECGLGERQIRAATARALATGYVTNITYDQIFRLAAAATRARQDELLRLRRRLQLADLI